MRHQLVDLRREQYTLRDSFAPIILTETAPAPYTPEEIPQMDCEVAVLPLGTKNNSELRGWIFRNWDELIPANYTEDMLEQISTYYW